ncbi:MAG: hypothetical protein PQJ46_16845 [Spirochaetales bacterium]|nr:hypothetical protein [Spirochaetales bacterium]
MKNKGIILMVLFIITAFQLSAEQAKYQPDGKVLNKASNIESEKDMNNFLAALDKKNPCYEIYYGICLHNISRTDAEIAAKAVDVLEAAYEKTENPIALGYLGSAISIKAGIASEAGNFISATGLLSKGLNKLDEAVNLMPDSDTLRFLRIFNSFDVTETSPVSRIKFVREDIAWMEKRMEGSPKSEIAYLSLAKGKLDLIDKDYDAAFAHLEDAIKTAPESSAAKQADEILWELEE